VKQNNPIFKLRIQFRFACSFQEFRTVGSPRSSKSLVVNNIITTSLPFTMWWRFR